MIFRKNRATRYYLFSGKGGVGKTSCAAATALHFANNGKKVLIISTDPAHSLSDSFEVEIGGEIKKIKRNLYAVEIDPKKAMDEYREKLAVKVNELEMLKGFGLEEGFELAGTAPGIDEIAAFDKFLQYMNSKEYDVIVFDTAPTGHTLRFLSLPDILDSWVGKVIKIRLTFAHAINTFKKLLPFGKSEDSDMDIKYLEELKDRVNKAREILKDVNRTTYVIVTIPEAMSILESKRAYAVLNEYGIPVKEIIVNQIIPANIGCDFCAAKREQQLKRIEEIKKIFSKLRIKEVEMFKEEIKGMEMLEKFAKRLYS
ncbi:MAG TPA: arsenic-transporting ATPase [Candidatus Aenigmarchaeota archaeon]|nr:MAG: arsenic-transporting ATPase [Candidatus Aenigmarchaeota archaeon]HDD46013.1 arsenic-transporting ATPase [Candidatus Aenigmarchaeota archaeon]